MSEKIKIGDEIIEITEIDGQKVAVVGKQKQIDPLELEKICAEMNIRPMYIEEKKPDPQAFQTLADVGAMFGTDIRSLLPKARKKKVPTTKADFDRIQAAKDKRERKRLKNMKQHKPHKPRLNTPAPRVIPDKKHVANKKACRGKVDRDAD